MGKKTLKSLFDCILLLFNMAVLVFAVLGFVAGDIDPNENYFFTFVALALPLTLLTAFILLIYYLWKKSPAFLIPLIAILFNYQYITSTIGTGGIFSHKESNSSIKLKVATYNIHGFNYCKDYIPVNDIAGFIEAEKIDVLCMQEYMPHSMYSEDEVKNAFSFLENSYIRESTLNEIGIAIYTKYKIMAGGKVYFPQSANGAVWVDIKLPDSSIVRIINVHMQTTGMNKGFRLGIVGTLMNINDNAKTRATQSRIIHNLINNTKYPVILAGDFNDTPSSYTYKTIKGKLKDSFKEKGIGLSGTYKHKFSFLRIDFIMHSKEFRCINYHSPSHEWSDHNPVVAKFEYLKP